MSPTVHLFVCSREGPRIHDSLVVNGPFVFFARADGSGVPYSVASNGPFVLSARAKGWEVPYSVVANGYSICSSRSPEGLARVLIQLSPKFHLMVSLARRGGGCAIFYLMFCCIHQSAFPSCSRFARGCLRTKWHEIMYSRVRSASEKELYDSNDELEHDLARRKFVCYFNMIPVRDRTPSFVRISCRFRRTFQSQPPPPPPVRHLSHLSLMAENCNTKNK